MISCNCRHPRGRDEIGASDAPPQFVRRIAPLGHKNTFAFMRVALGDEFSTIIGYFDRMRVKRNQVIYDVAGLITEDEAKAILAHATKFVETVKAELREHLD